MDNEQDNKALKFRTASLSRCTKAALFLHRLNSLRAVNNGEEEHEKLKKEMHDLKMELVKERRKNKKMKLCSFMELLLQVLLLLSLWTFFLAFFLRGP
ncbi:hypothetical protein HN51_025976 [Arachis hypogaea]|uniref:Uncharacterized protein n=2 Tax=Arachis TaxID=3817 RepID=A0A445CG32_ARAHY|nr:uncharacterized protein LOC107459109 [Arachis duranensis]RYR49870.1 hypothetical protein Ahy_A07g036397 [Arachis hypogaea]